MRTFLIRFLLAAFTLAGAVSLHAVQAGGNALLLSGDPALNDGVRESLPHLLAIQPTEIDYEAKAFVTDEGTRILFSQLLHDRSLQDNTAFHRLQLEYGSDYVVLAWIEREKREQNESYGLDKISVTVHVRVVDGATGKNIFDRSVDHSTDLTVSGTAEDASDNRATAIAAALGGLDKGQILAAIEQRESEKTSTGNRIRIVFQNLSQEDYFEQHDALLGLVQQAGVTIDIREHYAQDTSEFTIRAVISEDLDVFYRSLYATILSGETLEHFDMTHDGRKITVQVLPPERNAITVQFGNVSPADYRKIGAPLDRIIKSFEHSVWPGLGGIENLQKQYDAGAYRLIYTFETTVSPVQLDSVLWEKISDESELAGISQDTSSGTILSYSKVD